MPKLFLPLVLAVLIVSPAFAQKRKPAPRPTPRAATKPAEPPKPPEPPKPKPSAVEKLTVEELKATRATIETALGNITLEFFPDVAPIHVRNFLRLADQGYFNGTCFNRVVKNFVIQGGDPSRWPEDSPNRKLFWDTPKLQAEFSEVLHERGTLSMARPGNDENGATVHFFICLNRQEVLDRKYTAFGKVVEGMDVVDRIAAVPSDPGNPEKPADRIDVSRIRVIFPK